MAGKRGSGQGIRPHTWLTGEDPIRHEQYNSWHKARAQAHFRNEPWQLTFDEWAHIWSGHWHLRGRQRHCLMMMKCNWQKPWSKQNVELVNRDQFHQRQSQIKRERKAIRNDRSKV